MIFVNGELAKISGGLQTYVENVLWENRSKEIIFEHFTCKMPYFLNYEKVYNVKRKPS